MKTSYDGKLLLHTIVYFSQIFFWWKKRNKEREKKKKMLKGDIGNRGEIGQWKIIT